MWYVIVVVLFHLSILASGTIDYCGSKLCGHTNSHTFCQFPPGPGPQCVGFVDVPLSEEEKIRVLIRLNQRRAGAASGRLRRFPSASSMMKLTWIDELAWEAQLWANQCEPPSTPERHDACRDLYSVSVGQCVASVVGDAPGLRPESMIDLWYMQSMFYKGNVSNYILPSKNLNNYYGDFAQLLYAQSHMVGCGRSRFMVSRSGRLRSVERLVCNFAPRGPSTFRSIWTAGSPAADCPPGSAPDANIPELCAYQEMEHNIQEELHWLKSKAVAETSTTSISQTSSMFITETESLETVSHSIIEEEVHSTQLDLPQEEIVTDIQGYDGSRPEVEQKMYHSPEDKNSSLSEPPILSMMKFIPFFNEQKSGIFKSNSWAIYSRNSVNFVIVIVLTLFCKTTFV